MIQSDRSYKSFQNKNIKLLRPASEIAEDDIVLQPKININRAASLPFK